MTMRRARFDEGTAPGVALVSLGCAKNLVDSEVMLAGLREAGCVLVPQPADADVVVINTCGFLQAAADESLEHIRAACALKREAGVRKVLVAGCLTQRYAERLRAELPEVDGFLGVQQRELLADTVRDLLAGNGRPLRVERRLRGADFDEARLRLTPRHYAYLKISEGCNRRCAFCVIPRIRGRLRSKPPAAVRAEARALAATGARELILVSQDTSDYGWDLDRGRGLGALLEALDAAPEGPDWLRVLYLHPGTLQEDVFEALAAGRRLLPYLDLPIQHASDRVLRRMRRGTTAARMAALIARARVLIPDLVLRTTVMVGFPGETDDDVDRLCDFMETIEFDRLGCFIFSPEEGTHAAGLDGPVPAARAEDRRHRVMMLQQEIHQRRARRRVGRECEVVIDGPSAAQPGLLEARSYAEAPEQDPVILLPAGAGRPGERRRVRLTAVDGYDLRGEPLPPRAEGVAGARN